ncbi:hypothetical protein B296_00027676 [Ensete ventricosum]|uniref:Uncharacterized protein n=1 Tax=Ensete ventricosum TaxID=4639 RepID=A0A426Z511_ENSVE|nr:hypothetical protein B296_00027676 [Ensete ventricosum]
MTNSRGRHPRNPSPRPKEPLGKQIDVIVGGLASGGGSSSVRKAYAWAIVKERPRHDRYPEITFRIRHGCHSIPYPRSPIAGSPHPTWPATARFPFEG